MRRRRTTRSPVSSPVHTIDAGCRESSKPFAAYVNPNDLVSLCRTTLIGLYYDFFDSINRMALGLTGWWGARDDGADGEAEEGVKLLDQPGGEKKVKRRRRKEEVTGQYGYADSGMTHGLRGHAVLSRDGESQWGALLHEFGPAGMLLRARAESSKLIKSVPGVYPVPRQPS
jgi:hypothetical protein